MKEFETERLICRHVTYGDEEFLLDLYNQPDFIEMVYDRGLRTIQDVQEFMRKRIFVEHKKIDAGHYIVIRKKDQAKIGVVGLFDREGLEGFDIGFILLPNYYKKGYMLEAANALMYHAQHTFKLPKVSAITLEINRSSRALLEKLGLSLFRKDFKLPKTEEHLCLYEKKF